MVQITAMYCHGRFSPKVAEYLHSSRKKAKPKTVLSVDKSPHLGQLGDQAQVQERVGRPGLSLVVPLAFGPEKPVRRCGARANI